MKFDFCIGNPPYQEETVGEQKTFTAPVYNKFMDAAYQVADKVELIHPARFLFNAGSTPKAWNSKMLNNKHFKILHYEGDADKIFPNTDIKGGITISYYDKNCDFGAIEVFTQYSELNDILHKVTSHKEFYSLSKIVVTRTAYRLTDIMHRDYSEALSQLSKGHAYDMSTNIFERLPQVFCDKKQEDGHKYIQILGREKNQRIYKYIRAEYVNEPFNLYKYKIFLPSGSGNGKFGETLTTPVLSEPGVGATETFISIGCFENECESKALLKYIKSKFLRAMLGALKITQHLTPEVWKYVPLQDFTSASDIDWTQSIADIDKQLYKKYNLSEEEINFIETNVKEME